MSGFTDLDAIRNRFIAANPQAKKGEVGIQASMFYKFRSVIQVNDKVKDKILRLDDREMEQLTAAILRAMGYKTRITPVGPDRGVDVFASPDGLGLEQPRIRCEVKHRPKTQIGSQDTRSFLGGLREGNP